MGGMGPCVSSHLWHVSPAEIEDLEWQKDLLDQARASAEGGTMIAVMSKIEIGDLMLWRKLKARSQADIDVFNTWLNTMELNNYQAWICLNFAKLFIAIPNVVHVDHPLFVARNAAKIVKMALSADADTRAILNCGFNGCEVTVGDEKVKYNHICSTFSRGWHAGD
eukprot:m.288646 g.288646  ORF g.288646 m.288646 type:complete len:166 (-) comp27097_c1_seq5:1465-1962(-)